MGNIYQVCCSSKVILFLIFFIDRGATPYEGMNAVEVVRLLYNHEYLTKPDWCPDKVYELLESCWSFEPAKRPSFFSIIERIKDFVTQVEKLRYKEERSTKHLYDNLSNFVTEN